MAPSTTVLVVEDNPLLRLHAVDLLEEAGYATLEAPDADAALELLARHKEITVVFTDIDMPGSMDGLKLASAIRDLWPPIELVITSGHIAKLRPEMIPSGCRVLSRPFDESALIGTISASGPAIA